MLELKHDHPRCPINLRRLSTSICIQVFLKQSGVTMVRSKRTCRRVNKIIDLTVTHLQAFSFLLDILAQYGTAVPFPNGYGIYVFSHMPLMEIVRMRINVIRTANRLAQVDGRLMAMLNYYSQQTNSPTLEEIWEEQKRRGPKRLNLAKIPVHLLIGVLFKTPLLAVSRLSRSSSMMKRLVDDCFDSTKITAIAKRAIEKQTRLFDLYGIVDRTVLRGQSSKKALRLLMVNYITTHPVNNIELDEQEKATITRIICRLKRFPPREKLLANWEQFGYSFSEYEIYD